MEEAVVDHMAGMLEYLFVTTGLGSAGIGAILAASLACVGSAKGISTGASQSAGILTEKPELYARFLVMMNLPGTQGFYGFVTAILIAVYSGISGAEQIVGPLAGVALLFVGLGMGIAEWKSACYQGDTCAACINWLSKRPEDFGRAIILPVLVETYGVVAFLIAIFMVTWLTSGDLMMPAIQAG